MRNRLALALLAALHTVSMAASLIASVASGRATALTCASRLVGHQRRSASLLLVVALKRRPQRSLLLLQDQASGVGVVMYSQASTAFCLAISYLTKSVLLALFPVIHLVGRCLVGKVLYLFLRSFSPGSLISLCYHEDCRVNAHSLVGTKTSEAEVLRLVSLCSAHCSLPSHVCPCA